MDKDKIAAYRASRITRDYTFTDELLDAYEKLEKQLNDKRCARTIICGVRVHDGSLCGHHSEDVCVHVANASALLEEMQAKLVEVEQEREYFMMQAGWAINILNASDVPKEEQEACDHTLKLERERLDFYRNGKRAAEEKLDKMQQECWSWEGQWRDAQNELDALSDCIHQMRTRFAQNKHAREWADFVEEYVNVPEQKDA